MTRAASSATRIDAVDGLSKPVAHDLALNRDKVLHRTAAREPVHRFKVLRNPLPHRVKPLARKYVRFLRRAEHMCTPRPVAQFIAVALQLCVWRDAGSCCRVERSLAFTQGSLSKPTSFPQAVENIVVALRCRAG
jgi:hypothetical protein